MAIVSSGAVSLSDIATEFGGTAPHSMSEYYGNGNASASGAIQLASDFYGTANSFSATLSWATATTKSGQEILGYINSSSNVAGTNNYGGTVPTSLGSISAQPSTPNINHLFRSCQSVASDELTLEFASTFTAWTSITIGSKTFTRASASTGGTRTYAVTNQTYQWLNANNSTSTYITEDSGGSTSIQEDPFGTGTGSGSAPLPTGTVTITLNY